jgi:1,2-diacylglycerol 3-alpha-glucosyltransferase
MSKLFHIPMVHTYHTMYEDYMHYILNGQVLTPKAAQRFSRVFCNRARVVIAPAEKTKKYLAGIGVARPIEVIPTGLDFSPFDPSRFGDDELAREREALGIARDDPVIVSVGRVAKEKSLDMLIEMMPLLLETLPAAKLLIVGEGPSRGELEALSETLGVRASVIFAGVRPWEVIGKYYRLSDVFMTASTTETQGLTYIEAMAARVPVVVRRDPSFEALIRHGETGFLFDDAQSAAEAALYALTHPDETAAVTERGCEAIRHLSAEAFGLAVERVYRSLLDVIK